MGTGRVCRGLTACGRSSPFPPPSSLPQQQPTETSSTSITETINGSHSFDINGFSLLKGMGIGKYVPSDTFTVGGYQWAVYFYPDGKSPEDNTTYVSLFIALASEGTDVRALLELTLLDQSGRERHMVHTHFGRTLEGEPYTLKYRGSMWGYKRFFKRAQLETSDYLKDDRLQVRCTVGVVRSHTEGPKMFAKLPEEEARPLLPGKPQPLEDPPQPKPSPVAAPLISPPAKWAAEGLPLSTAAQGTVVMGSPISPGGRDQWNSSICACLGRNDDFCSSDVEVCLLGSLAPCVLYGSNAERLGAVPPSFANNCLSYTGIYLLGNSLFGWNCLAPWFSYPTRSAIRRNFNLEGSGEAFSRSCGCCSSVVENEERREQLESACDLATHLFCHPCALCQEGRELRRRLPHPGFNGRSVFVMIPPMEQTMGRAG